MQLHLSAVLLLLLPSPAQPYSQGAGSCHTARDGHGEATTGDGGFRLTLLSAPEPGATVTMRLEHSSAATLFKGFLVKVTGPGGDYDGGGAAFAGLETHALAQAKSCYGPAAATHRSPNAQDAVELQLTLPPEPIELIVTVIVMISRLSMMESVWYTWPVPVSVAEQPVALPPPQLQPGDTGSCGSASDVNNDGIVGVDDLLHVLSAYGQPVTPCDEGR
jgi:hypothetical protein